MTTALIARTAPTVRPPWLVAADLSAILLLAVEGGLMAVAAGLGPFGVLVVAFVSSLGGGLIRDLIVQRHPPAAFGSILYPATALVGGMVAALGHGVLDDLLLGVRAPFDAAALGLLCVVGAIIALDRGTSVLGAVVLGTVSAIGGGVIRDLLTGTVPLALRHDVSAVAAAAGAAATVIALRCRAPRSVAAVLGVVVCASLSMVATAQGWRLPALGG
ncbi:trimeric intracellular cation channel family protein [Pseudonocardia sp. GCM10023141]|uniref:trimeric intracellular cation channel family protein n=1 Tax=Pseudonocardia sp. GCM10023141 TaxID=3252653 RepID=UPI0036086DC0